MREYQERRFFRKLIFSKFAFAFLAAILIFMVYSTAKIYLRSREAKKINGMVQKEIDVLSVKKQDLQSAVKRLESEAGQEEELRARFPIKKPGEKTIIIIEEENKNNSSGAVSLSFFQKIRQFFRSVF